MLGLEDRDGGDPVNAFRSAVMFDILGLLRKLGTAPVVLP